eukprot:3002532-Amphidinium_carterae.1
MEHLKEHCQALETQMRSVARALTMKGTLSRSEIEWHDGRHDLFDQLMDDCAGEIGDVEGGTYLEGPDTAPPGGHGRVVPHLSLLEGLGNGERVGNQPESLDKAPPGRLDGEVAGPRTPENRGTRRLQTSSPEFGVPG